MFKKGQSNPWFFDFRVTQILPDIKIIRTNFILNFISIFFFVSALGFFFYSQKILSDKESTLQRLSSEAGSLAVSDRQNLALSKDFQEGLKPLSEFIGFFQNEVTLPYVLDELARGCPDDLAFRSVSYRFEKVAKGTDPNQRSRGNQPQAGQRVPISQIVIEGAVRGSAQEALVLLDDYKRLLQAMSLIREYITSIAVVPSGRTESSQLINFTITIQLTFPS